MNPEVIKLGHGSGGLLSRRLIEERILRHFGSPVLAALGDSALVDVGGGRVLFTTDSYVVDPVFFPGGDIGRLSVCGTVNDLAVAGAVPAFISCALIIEEGFPAADLDRILASMSSAAEEAGVSVVTGDTKVVPRGKADGIFINTAGLGHVAEWAGPLDSQLQPGDSVIVSGSLGEHAAAVLTRREGLGLQSSVESDCAPLTEVARAVLENAARVPFMRDVTRGGLATVLNEAVAASEFGIVLREAETPVSAEVRAICELLGLDPLYMACEGRLAAVVDAADAARVVKAVSGTDAGTGCRVVGTVTEKYGGKLVAETPFGAKRLVQMLSGEQLPRIC